MVAQRDDARWVEVSPSQFAHEREGLDSVREWLTRQESPYRAWSNFEFRDAQGGWHECDLLVLGPGGLYLVELKYYSGRLTGDDTRWVRHPGRVERSPLLLCRRKAQRLASKLKDAAKEWALEKRVEVGPVVGLVPFVQEAVFLHHPDFVSDMSGSAALGLYGLEGEEAERSSHLPPLTSLLTQAARPGREIGANQEQILVKLMARIGLVQRREREAGSWVIQEGVVDEGVSAQGFAWQDWRCSHLADPSRQGRVRFFLSPPNVGTHDARRRADVARNEFRLSRTLQHEAILTPEDFVHNDLGAGLVYQDDGTWQRLDLWMAGHAPVPLDVALSLVRQVADGLRYAHAHGIAHRTLGAGSVWVRPRDGRTATDGGLDVQIRDWSFAGRVEAAGTGAQQAHEAGLTGLAGGITPSSPVGATAEATGDRWLTEAFTAPESQWLAPDRVRVDVFALGALAAYVVTGRAPASSAADLREQLRSQGDGIDVSLLGAAPESLRALIRRATHPVVGKRTESVPDFLDELDRATVALTAAEEATADPLDALPGAVLAGGRFVVEKRLGKGSTARGLLVADAAEPARPHRVLKVALDDKAEARLTSEAEVLKAITGAKSLARLIEGPMDVDGRLALLLESAGTHTLAEELRPDVPVPLDFLQRWGRDVLDAVVELDRLGVDHRDIKPSNLGVRLNPGNREAHLVLFDFSLTRAAAEEVQAGTAPYRDPFLGEGTRRRFDSAAERYSAAVVLFEMATGHPPVFGDGLTLPSLIPDEATIDPKEFPEGLAGDFADFFRRALRRQAGERFDSASSMRQAWDRMFATDVTTQAPTGEDDRRAEAATLDTPLTEAGLTARGLSALARFKVVTVRDFLLKVDAGHPYYRVAPYTRNHLRQRRSAWEKRLGLPRAAGGSLLSDGVDLTVSSLVGSSGPDKATVRRRLVRLLLGAEGSLEAFAPMTAFAQELGVPEARAEELLGDALSCWSADAQATDMIDALGSALDRRIAEMGGAITRGEAAAAVLDATQEPLRGGAVLRGAEGLVRLALERRRFLRRLGGGTAWQPLSVRRRDGSVIMLGSRPGLFDAWEAVGRAAEDLVLRATGADASIIIPSATAGRELAAALAPFGGLFERDEHPQESEPEHHRAEAGVAVPTQSETDGEATASPEARGLGRLVRVGAELAPHAAAAGTLDLHHVDLPQRVALAEAFRGYAGTTAREARGRTVLTPRDLRLRVRRRFPAVATLPDRPLLDDLVKDSGADLRWDEALRGYVVPERSLTTTGLVTATPTVAGGAAARSLRDPVAARLAESVATRSFLALGVGALDLARVQDVLRERYDAHLLDVTGLLIDAMRAAAARHGVPWDVVLASDAATPGTRDRANLEQLVGMCLPEVWEAIASAIAATPHPGEDGAAGPSGGSAEAGHAKDAPVVLTDVAPLARYRHLGELSRWSDVALPRERAVWVLAPQTPTSQGPVIDGQPLPLSSPGQYVRLDLRRLYASDDQNVPAAAGEKEARA
ncbi:MAG: BREX system serine/threonine kinase PglW [Austwickia sp.]|nr:MAG: BREX system serine/threonine kinase PglW [Austwickia sp.]